LKAVSNGASYGEQPQTAISILLGILFTQIFSHNAIIFQPNQNFRINWQHGSTFEIVLSDEERNLIAQNNAWLWVYGKLVYTNFIGEVHEMGFVAHWEATVGATLPNFGRTTARGMVIEGPPQFLFDRLKSDTASGSGNG
jgi:hypothetical protein